MDATRGYCVLFLLVSAFWAPRLMCETWTIECADCPPYFAGALGHQLALDAAGDPVVAFGGDHLYVARRTGASWNIETVDPKDGVGWAAAVAVDSVGYLHVAYFDDPAGAVRYAYEDAAGWHLETVDSAGNVGYHLDLVLDSGDHPHLAYGDNTASHAGLYYAHNDGSGWQIETVESGHVAFYVSIALTGSASPRIGYEDNHDQSLMYAVRGAGGWTLETVESSGSERAVMILDASDQPHFSYERCSSGCQVKHAWYEGGSWHTEVVANGGGTGTAIAEDGSGVLHAAWSDTSVIQHCTRGAGSWACETVETGTTQGYFNPSLITDGSDVPLMVYFDNDTKDLRFADRSGGSWSTETVETSQRSGDGAALCLDSAGNPHVSSKGGSALHTDLRHVFRDSGGWHVEVLDTNIGIDTTIAVDPASHVHICYWHLSGGGLEYAWFNGSAWILEEIQAGIYGAELSLDLDSSNFPHLAFADRQSGTLGYAYRDASGWHVETADASSNTGEGCSLVMDASDHPHISYYDASNRHLKYAVNDGSGWQTETADAADGVGQFTSLALDDTGDPHITYWDEGPAGDPHWAVKYAFKDTGGWHSETVTTGAAGLPTSLALDDSGTPRVVYGNGDDIFYVEKTGGSWVGETVFAGNASPGSEALELDAAQRPILWFQNKDTWDLEVAMPFTGTLPGDVNLDGTVDGADMVALVGHLFGTPAPNPDVDDNGTTDIRDTVALIEILAPG